MVDNAPQPSRGSSGLAGSVLCGEPSSPALPEPCSEGQGVKLMLISVNTRRCFGNGLKVRHQVQSCFEAMWWAGMVSSPPALPDSQGNWVGLSAIWERPCCVDWPPDGILTPCITPHCHWTWVQPSQARIQYFITCYFQLCYWRFTATAKPSHSLSLCFISPSTEQKLQYLPPFMNSSKMMHDTYYLFYPYEKQRDFTFGCSDWWTGNTGCCAQLHL